MGARPCTHDVCSCICHLPGKIILHDRACCDICRQCGLRAVAIYKELPTMSLLIQFYSGQTPDVEGRYIEDILAFTDEELEYAHDYIQWLFPLPEASRFYARAPILTEADIAAFKSSPDLLARVRDAVARMTTFYRASEEVRTPGDHNHLRITRIIRFLTLVGLNQEARSFFNLALEVAPLAQETSKRFWVAALVL